MGGTKKCESIETEKNRSFMERNKAINDTKIDIFSSVIFNIYHFVMYVSSIPLWIILSIISPLFIEYDHTNTNNGNSVRTTVTKVRVNNNGTTVGNTEQKSQKTLLKNRVKQYKSFLCPNSKTHCTNPMSKIAKVIRFQSLSKFAIKPKKILVGNAGHDVYPTINDKIYPNKRLTIPLEVALELPSNIVAFMTERSGSAKKYGIITAGNIIDPNY
ncbi:MAG: hypothetical protein GY928_11540, partial [Colwellia sp.]|nr:hypothetical protein [Colwellia sp.]